MSSVYEMPIARVLPASAYRPVSAAHDALRIVCFGGGTGLSTLLRGLKKGVHTGVVSRLTAVVAVTDDGGSSGRLRNDFNMLPPGDIRNCLVALADDEALLARIFDYRFTEGSGCLTGHSVGNLLLAALERMTGDFVAAVRMAARLLVTCGDVLPATTVPCDLYAVLKDGNYVVGETAIATQKAGIQRLGVVAEVCEPLPATLEAIAHADLITFGPGSLFTSLAPHLLVNGVAEAIAASPARKVFVCNIMTQEYETTGFTAADHVRALYEHAGKPLFDAIVVNRPKTTAKASASESPVRSDRSELQALGLEVIDGDFMSESAPARHASDRIANALFDFATRDHRVRAECAS